MQNSAFKWIRCILQAKNTTQIGVSKSKPNSTLTTALVIEHSRLLNVKKNR